MMSRTPLIVIGIVLAALGAAALIWGRIGYTQRETLVDVGPVKLSADTAKSVPLSPIVGGIILAGGAALVAFGASRTDGQSTSARS